MRMRDRVGDVVDEPLVRAFAAIVTVLVLLFLTQFAFQATGGDPLVPGDGAADGTPESEVSTTGGMLNVSALERVNETEVERLVLLYVNEARRSNGLDPLTADGRLDDVARVHSDEMARHGYLGHEDRSGRGPTRRANELGYRCLSSDHSGLGENVARTYFQRGTQTNAGEYAFYEDENELARGVVEQWLRSEGHRQAMMATFFDRAGTGVSVTDEGAVYVTQMFC